MVAMFVSSDTRLLSIYAIYSSNTSSNQFLQNLPYTYDNFGMPNVVFSIKVRVIMLEIEPSQRVTANVCVC
jgi:hypothetical protein